LPTSGRRSAAARGAAWPGCTAALWAWPAGQGLGRSGDRCPPGPGRQRPGQLLNVLLGALVLSAVIHPAGSVDRTALRWHVGVWDLWFLVW